MPQVVGCFCCPDGYFGPSPAPGYPNGVCKNLAGISVPATPCQPCAETMSTDCIILPAIDCFGLPAGTTLTGFLTYMCSSAFVESIISRIGLDPVLGSGFCQLVQNCPPVSGGTTPIIGSITVTFP
jgi:hypothetical protein